MGWNGKENGELLDLMVAQGFDIFITIDGNLRYQQNISNLSLSVFVLQAPDNRISSLEPLMSLIKYHLNSKFLQKGIIEIKS